MSLFITQCPHCHTSFRTSVSQLQSADGMVRCGACLRVFAADDNLLPSVDIRTVNIPAPDDTEEDEDFEALDEQLPISELDIEDEDEDDDSENEADGVFTLDMADSLPNRLSPSISTSEPFWHLIEEDNAAEDLPPVETAEVDEDDEPIQNLEPEESAKPRDEQTIESSLGDTAFPLEEQKDIDVSGAQRDEHAQIRSRMTAIDFDDDAMNDNPDARSFTRFSAEEIDGVSDAESPLELDWRETPRRSGSAALLWVLCLLLGLGIAGQYLWFNKDSLSQNARIRPLLDGVCGALQCELPPLVNIRAIRSDTLVVRSHDEISNALSVNFQFRNDATFAQPFPSLALRFMDADDTLVAQRLFAPQEYLPEGVADLRLMPPNAPVQVRLDILDPGGKAINYELSFFASQPK